MNTGDLDPYKEDTEHYMKVLFNYNESTGIPEVFDKPYLANFIGNLKD